MVVEWWRRWQRHGLVGFSARAAAPCRTRTTHPDAAGVATALSRNRRRKRARGKYGREVACLRARRFGKLDSPATDVIRFAAFATGPVAAPEISGVF